MRKLVILGENLDHLITKKPKVVLDEIVRNACQFTGADAAVVYPFDPLREQFYDTEKVSAHGLNKSLKLTEKPRSKKGLAAFVMREGEIVIENIEEEDPECPYGARGVGEIGLVPTAPAVAGACGTRR